MARGHSADDNIGFMFVLGRLHENATHLCDMIIDEAEPTPEYAQLLAVLTSVKKEIEETWKLGATDE